ncbi:MAG: cytidine deaminase [Actinomadura sp.]
MSEIDAEDAKIVTLARSVRARTGAAEGAAVRDETGRTYAAATVELPSLRLSALQVAVAMAVSSGAEDLEAAVLVTAADTVADADVAAVRDLGRTAPVLVAGLDGTLRSTLTA